MTETTDTRQSLPTARAQATDNCVPAIPGILDPSTLDDYRRKFFDEYAPVGPTEATLVVDLARQAAAMERWSAAALAAERQGAIALPMLTCQADSEGRPNADAVLVSAMTTDAADRSERHSLARSRAFLRTLKRLEEVQDRRKQQTQLRPVVAPPPFADERACEAYLENRLRSELRRCAECGSQRGCFLPSRRTWECGNCRMQASLRSGTVMAGSALPLFIWCEAIRLLLWQPRTGTAELAKHLGIRRSTTVRKVARRIREALAADDASDQLAGLDRHFARAAVDLKQVRVEN